MRNKHKELIEKQYEKGIVELSSIIEPLIESFKNDKTLLDFQQLQLITHYLILEREFNENYIDELEKGE